LFSLVSYLTNVRVTPGNRDLALCSASVHPWEVRVGKVCAVDVGGGTTFYLNCKGIKKL